MKADAVAFLADKDPILGQLIAQVGPCRLVCPRSQSVFECLVRAIAHQQLTAHAANSILRRFIALAPDYPFPTAESLQRVTDEQLRQVGFSRAKVSTLRELASKVGDGSIPTRTQLSRLDDESVVKRVSAVRGIGRWTAEMLLIFGLGRSDVLPACDYGVRTGVQWLYGLPQLPSPKQVQRRGEQWRPWRSIASWYLWRGAELAKRSVSLGLGAEPEPTVFRHGR